MKFTPPPNQSYRYAVWTNNNRSGFKVYSNLGAAKQALEARTDVYYRDSKTRVDSKILEMVDGEWFVLFEVPVGTSKEEMPWKKEVRKNRWSFTDKSTFKKAVPMTREEYAQWRVEVELEKRGIVAAVAAENREVSV